MKIGRVGPPVKRKRERHHQTPAARRVEGALEEQGEYEVLPDYFTVRKLAVYWENCIFGCKHFRTKATRILISDI